MLQIRFKNKSIKTADNWSIHSKQSLHTVYKYTVNFNLHVCYLSTYWNDFAVLSLLEQYVN